MCGVNSGLFFPLKTLATSAARRPSVCPSASTTYHFLSILSGFHWLTSYEFQFTNYFHCRFYRKQVHSGALVQTVSSHVILAYYIIPTGFCQLFLADFHHFFVGIFYSISFRLSTVSSAFTSVILPLSRHSTNLYTKSGSNCLPAS